MKINCLLAALAVSALGIVMPLSGCTNNAAKHKEEVKKTEKELKKGFGGTTKALQDFNLEVPKKTQQSKSKAVGQQKKERETKPK